MCGVLERFVAGVLFLQIELKVFHLGGELIPFTEGFDVHGANVRVALAEQVRHEMTADEIRRRRRQQFFLNS